MKPAAVLLPIAGILLVTSEWSQRTGMITFALVPVRSRVLGAKLVASLVLAVAMLAVTVGIVAAGVLVASPGVDGDLVRRRAADRPVGGLPDGGMLTGVAFGMVLLASAPAIVALFALPIAWTAVASLSFFADAAPWLDTRLALGPLHAGGHERHPVGARRHRARALDAAPAPDRRLADHAAGGRRVITAAPGAGSCARSAARSRTRPGSGRPR